MMGACISTLSYAHVVYQKYSHIVTLRERHDYLEKRLEGKEEYEMLRGAMEMVADGLRSMEIHL